MQLVVPRSLKILFSVKQVICWMRRLKLNLRKGIETIWRLTQNRYIEGSNYIPHAQVQTKTKLMGTAFK